MDAVPKPCGEIKMASNVTVVKGDCIGSAFYMGRKTSLQLGGSDDPWYCARCSLPAFSDSCFKDSANGHSADGCALCEYSNISDSGVFDVAVDRLSIIFCHQNM